MNGRRNLFPSFHPISISKLPGVKSLKGDTFLRSTCVSAVRRTSMEPNYVPLYEQFLEAQGRPPLDPGRRRFIPGHIYRGPEFVDNNQLEAAINNGVYRDPRSGRTVSLASLIHQTDREWRERYNQELRIVTGNWPDEVLHNPLPIRTVAFETHLRLQSNQDTWDTLDYGLAVSYVIWWLHEGAQFFVEFRLCNPFFGTVAERQERYADEYLQTWRTVARIINNRVRVQHLVRNHDRRADQLLLDIYRYWDQAFGRLRGICGRAFWEELQQQEDRDREDRGEPVVAVGRAAVDAVDPEVDQVPDS